MDNYYQSMGRIEELMEENDIPRVSRREFEQYTSKYLKDLPVIVTNRGVDDFIVREI